MANLHAATTSSGARVTDQQAVEQLCERHYFGELMWEVDIDEEAERCPEFHIWGYDSFDVYERRDDGEPDYESGLVTEAFLSELAEYICEDEELNIQAAGFTKCRYPPYAVRYIVRSDGFVRVDLDGWQRSSVNEDDGHRCL